MTDQAPTATGQLDPQAWMTAPETRAVLDALGAGGREVRFIGGCVRDAVLKIPIKDIDIATPEPPERVIELLEAAAIRAVPTGIDHGTVTAVVGNKHFEVTTLRIDVESHGRRATVAFTDDWRADAMRRDFTINTLSCTADGAIHDPLGGLEDLGKRWVRFVGIAQERIEEDLLRLLRFFRFQATYGDPPPDNDALAACRKLAPRLAELSAERVTGEIFRTLLAPNPADTMILMRGERVLEHILPEAVDFGRLRLLTWLETTALRVPSVAPDPLRRLAAMLPTDGAGYHGLAQRMRLSRYQGERLAAMTRPGPELAPEMAAKARRLALHQIGAAAFRDRTLLAWAGEMALQPRHPHERTDAWLALIAAADAWTPRQFPLRGQDAIDLGLVHGPAIGVALSRVEEWWRDGDFRADRAACLAHLKSLIGEAP